MAQKDCFFGAVRRRTFICCRSTKISASSVARDRIDNHPTNKQRSLITQQHCPILDPLPSQIKFATGTGECRDLRPKQRSHLPDRGYPIRSTGSPSHEAKNQAGNPLGSSKLRRKV